MKQTAEAVLAKLTRGITPLELGNSVDESLSVLDIARSAASQIAERIGLNAYSHPVVDEHLTNVPILNILACAFLSAVSHESEDAALPPTLGNEIINRLLEHEGRYWLKSAYAEELMSGPDGLTPAAVRKIVAVANLLGTTSESEAIALIARVPHVRPTLRIANWLRELYPPRGAIDPITGRAEWIGAVQPDQLTDTHIAAELLNDGSFANSCFVDLDARQVLHAYVAPSRARGVDERLDQHLSHLLVGVAQFARRPDLVSIRALATIAAGMPYPQIALRIASMALGRQRVELPTRQEGEEWETWLRDLHALIIQVARSVSDYPADSVDIDISTARKNTAVYTKDAADLLRMGEAFAEIDLRAPAIASLQECAAILEGLAHVFPLEYEEKMRPCNEALRRLRS